jgi:4-alpha-glucanotransferase
MSDAPASGASARAAGVLLHPSSLPAGAQRAGLGISARRFIDFLEAAGLQYWQMLPVHPADLLGSPYQSASAFAGDVRLIAHDSADSAVDADRYHEFLARHEYWLDDYAGFRVAKYLHDGAPWWEWNESLRRRDRGALATLFESHAAEIERHRREQYVFFRQWHRLREYARSRGVALIGDAPIFVAHDSADVWAHRELFCLDARGQPTVVAGVPPDYFSADGQRWGNPLYDWKALEASGFRWWRERIRVQLELFDRLRLDHFRGFEAYWEIPADAATAARGAWRPGPGAALFEALRRDLGALPFIAEDLGVITPAVTALRHTLGVPGITVLQFAFDGGAKNPYLPHHHRTDTLVCTGTHDNDTTVGWYAGLGPATRARVDDYLGEPRAAMPWPLIRAAFASVAQLAIVPMQDFLGLDSRHRMNTPGTTKGNWRWVMAGDALTPALAARIRHLVVLYDRI